MSHDIIVFEIGSPPPPFDELPNDWEGALLGTIDTVQRKLESVVPEIEWTDIGWGAFDNGELSIEFNLGDDEICTNLMLHVRGDFKNQFLAALLKSLEDKYNWYALDIEQGEWIQHGATTSNGPAPFKPVHYHELATTKNKSLWRRLLDF
jgi:hypothetical protein